MLSFFPVATGSGALAQLLAALCLGVLLEGRTDHGEGRVFAFALTTLGAFLLVGFLAGYGLNEPPTPPTVVLVCWLFGLSVGYTVWLGDGLARVRERLTRRSTSD
jgi:hypothetical protein